MERGIKTRCLYIYNKVKKAFLQQIYISTFISK